MKINQQLEITHKSKQVKTS